MQSIIGLVVDFYQRETTMPDLFWIFIHNTISKLHLSNYFEALPLSKIATFETILYLHKRHKKSVFHVHKYTWQECNKLAYFSRQSHCAMSLLLVTFHILENAQLHPPSESSHYSRLISRYWVCVCVCVIVVCMCFIWLKYYTRQMGKKLTQASAERELFKHVHIAKRRFVQVYIFICTYIQ